jgi:hypothetical protein
MPILNYTTTIAADKTLGEIQRMLARKGATRMMVDYDPKEGEPVGIAFAIVVDGQTLHYRLPCRWEGVEARLRGDHEVPARLKTRAQALRVGWRILKDWVEAQLALIDGGGSTVEETMMPYAITPSGRTVYEVYRDNRYQLEDKGSE